MLSRWFFGAMLICQRLTVITGWNAGGALHRDTVAYLRFWQGAKVERRRREGRAEWVRKGVSPLAGVASVEGAVPLPRNCSLLE